MKERTLTLTTEQKKKLDDLTLDALDSMTALCDELMLDDLAILHEALDKAEATKEIDADDIIHAGKSFSRHISKLSDIHCTLCDYWHMKHGQSPMFDTLDRVNQAIREEAEAREEAEEGNEA